MRNKLVNLLFRLRDQVRDWDHNLRKETDDMIRELHGFLPKDSLNLCEHEFFPNLENKDWTWWTPAYKETSIPISVQCAFCNLRGIYFDRKIEIPV